MSFLRRTFRLSWIAITVFVLNAGSFAADAVMKGYLVDVACSARRARKAEPPTRHSRLCMQMPSCNDNGYGILTEDKQFIQFDEEGNQKARKLLAESGRENDFKIAVSGSMDGGKLKVTKIELQ